MFIFRTHVGTLSRLDRIYTKSMHKQNFFQWKIGPTNVPTDHDIVSACFAPSDAPHIGKGCCTWPLYLMNNEQLINIINRLGLKLEKDIEVLMHKQSDTQNIQRLWKQFKDKSTKIVRKTAQSMAARIDNKIKALKRDIRATSNSGSIDEDANERHTESLLHNELKHLENKHRANIRSKAQAQWVSKGEKISKYWSLVNKQKKPRDLIQRLQIPGTQPPRHTIDSTEMAKIARDYHNKIQINLQSEQCPKTLTELLTNEILNKIPEEQKLKNPNQSELNELIKENDIQQAIKAVKVESTVGIDGIPYEL